MLRVTFRPSSRTITYETPAIGKSATAVKVSIKRRRSPSPTGEARRGNKLSGGGPGRASRALHRRASHGRALRPRHHANGGAWGGSSSLTGRAGRGGNGAGAGRARGEDR